MRGKYAPLHQYLSNLEGREWPATFHDIERILGANLPPSARTYQEWWNPNDRTHSQARAWMAADWEPSNVNLRAETVVFRRAGVSVSGSKAPASRPMRAIAPPLSKNEKASTTRAAPPSVIPAKAGIQRTGEVTRHTTPERRKFTNKGRLPFDINALLMGLSRSRPIFHSEADFQHALAWHIHKVIPNSQVRLEYPVRYDDSAMYLDIWLPMQRIAIELKYPTRMLDLKGQNERFVLVDHGAQPPRRYDYLKDIQRIESVVANGEATGGFAVLLTNHPYYWERPTRGWRDAIDAAFRLHEGRTVTGHLTWSERAGAGTTRGRRDAIGIAGTYDLRWHDYSRLGDGNNQQFRYLAVAVQ